ncbi:large subunit ribosomal protein L17 [Tangfeifania diversioriginum]|uniref:Large ribosomal subunit protein bL17 n=1 Tax=Tangfeifania diversioriginum TaxID=1168035 RepID=A0A1M6NHE1_9BACT|nr:large subunit ribosomal protein L17 [Tangfeifania diversioriginum]
MRHNKKFNHLSRTSAHRKAMLSNMASSLIESKRISTTVAKAKALRMYVEPLITRAKNDTTHSRRIVFSQLQNKEAVSELFREVAAKVADRPGGYTRILRTGNRLGDNAEMCIIELVDYNEAMLEAKEEAAKPKRRRSRRGGSGKKSDAQKPAAQKSEKPAEKADEEVKVVEDVQPVEETEEKTEVVEKPKAEDTSSEEPKAESADEAKKADDDSDSKEDKKKEE